MSRGLKPNGSRLPFAEWPEADRAAWKVALMPADPLEPGIGYASRWKPATRKLIVDGYSCWLAWLAASGKLDPTSTAAARTTRPLVRAYLDELEASELAPYTIALRLQNLGNALRAIAPAHDWSWVNRGAGRIHCRATPTRDRGAILQPAEAVLKLGFDLIHAAEHDRFRTPLERATLYRDGLLILALVYRPLRSRNFHSIEIGTGLHRRGDRWFLETDASETKGGRHQEAAWPTVLAEPLDRYIAVHRPVLIACTRKNLPPTSALWISNHGTRMTTHAISFQIRSRTKEEFGKPINPHSFRHLAATTIATADPEGVLDIQAVLGHASPATGEKFYNKAKMVDAGRRYQQSLEFWTDKK